MHEYAQLGDPAVATPLSHGLCRCAQNNDPVVRSHYDFVLTLEHMLNMSRSRRDQRFGAKPSADVSLGLRQCALLNISVCEATVEASAEGRGFRCACRDMRSTVLELSSARLMAARAIFAHKV